MHPKRFEYYTVGEAGPPYTSMSEKSMARVMKAVLLADAQITDTYVTNKEYAPRCSVLYAVKIPSDKVQLFRETCGYELSRSPDIQIGMETHKSIKSVIYDE